MKRMRNIKSFDQSKFNFTTDEHKIVHLIHVLHGDSPVQQSFDITDNHILMTFKYFWFTGKQDKLNKYQIKLRLYYIFKYLDVLLISILGSSKAYYFYVSVHFSDLFRESQKCLSTPKNYNKIISHSQN